MYLVLCRSIGQPMRQFKLLSTISIWASLDLSSSTSALDDPASVSAKSSWYCATNPSYSKEEKCARATRSSFNSNIACRSTMVFFISLRGCLESSGWNRLLSSTSHQYTSTQRSWKVHHLSAIPRSIITVCEHLESSAMPQPSSQDSWYFSSIRPSLLATLVQIWISWSSAACPHLYNRSPEIL